MQINLKEFTSTLKTVALAASKDNARPVLNGIYFECKKNTLSITAADGFRLAHGEIKISNPNNEKWGTIIPAKDLAALKLKGADVEIEYFNNGLKENPSEEKYNDSGLIIAGNKIQCIDGTFPDYWQIVPKKENTKREITLPADFASHAKAIYRMAKTFAVSNVAEWWFGETAHTLMTQSEESGSCRRDFDNPTPCAPFTFAINALYLHEAVKEARGKIVCKFRANNAPVLMEFDNIVMVIMPMHKPGMPLIAPVIEQPIAAPSEVYHGVRMGKDHRDSEAQALWEDSNAKHLAMARADIWTPSTPMSTGAVEMVVEVAEVTPVKHVYMIPGKNGLLEPEFKMVDGKKVRTGRTDARAQIDFNIVSFRNVTKEPAAPLAYTPAPEPVAEVSQPVTVVETVTTYRTPPVKKVTIFTPKPAPVYAVTPVADPRAAVLSKYAWIARWEADPVKSRYKATINNAKVDLKNELAALDAAPINVTAELAAMVKA